MNAIISSEIMDVDILKNMLDQVPSMAGLELASKVSTKMAYEKKPENPVYKIAAFDFGIKQNIVDCLVERGCHVKVYPATTSSSEMDLEILPLCIMLSQQ
jgi:carbamoyl-phosphate synthase small subunit